MTDFDTEEIVYHPEDTGDQSPNYSGNSTELFKKWFKTPSASGFLSINTWLAKSKLIVDVGKLGGDGKVASSTKCFVDAIGLTTYLHSVVHGTATELFPKRAQCPSPESFVAFGGSGNVSRIFKVHYWGAKQDNIGDPKGFAWKCGHFKGNTKGNGAIEPVWNEPISQDMIKITRLEMHEMYLRINYCLSNFAEHSTLYL